MDGWFDIGQLAGLEGVSRSRTPADSAGYTKLRNFVFSAHFSRAVQ